MSKTKYKCIVCDKEIHNYEPEFCCSGRECGCLGQPVEPPICSKECYDKLVNNDNEIVI